MNQKPSGSFDRVIWVVIDGVGAGALSDAKAYGDEGSNTLGNLATALASRFSRQLALPNLEAMGIGNITSMPGVPPRSSGQGEGAFGKALERSLGKDTTSGHWEMAGLIVQKAFPTFPEGFAKEVVNHWISENNLPGVLGNRPASGTEIIKELGEEHIRTGKPILYTSADSVWQVAAHEEAFGLERLYKICKSARTICDELQISRVIARPFIGNPAEGKPFQRTYRRKDYAQAPFAPTFLDQLTQNKIHTLGIGKISSIYAGCGISQNIDTAGNTDGIRVLLEQLGQIRTGLIYCNLIDFDMLYGHRRDIQGFANALEEFDRAVPIIKARMSKRDLFLVASDHGNDPTFRGTDHTREHIPIVAYTPAQTRPGPVDLGLRTSFGDIGATAMHALLGSLQLDAATAQGLVGKSFLSELVS
jgi:phosphopentomutase